MANEQYQKILDEQLALAKKDISSFLTPVSNLSNEQARQIIGVYRVAIEPNFIPWMQRACETSRNETAREVIMKNIYEEISQDHPKMLRDFAKNCGVSLTEKSYSLASKPVMEMWNLISKDDRLINITIAATLECTSGVFIPYLAELGKKLGCKDFTYTNVHGEADIEHAKQLYAGTLEEMETAINPWRTIYSTVDKTVGFLENILTAR